MDKENNKLKNISYIAAGCVFAAVLLSLLNLVNKDYSLYGNYFEWIGSSHNYENFLERYRPLFQLVAYIMIDNKCFNLLSQAPHTRNLPAYDSS